MAEQQPEHVVFLKIDTDENPDLAREWDIQGIPAMVKIENGQETSRLIGYRPASDIQKFIDG